MALAAIRARPLGGTDLSTLLLDRIHNDADFAKGLSSAFGETPMSGWRN
jgi:hypothetical protein